MYMHMLYNIYDYAIYSPVLLSPGARRAAPRPRCHHQAAACRLRRIRRKRGPWFESPKTLAFECRMKLKFKMSLPPHSPFEQHIHAI